MMQVQFIRSIPTNLRCTSFREASSQAQLFRDKFGTLSETGSKTLAVHRAEKELPEDADGYDKEEFDLTPRKNAYYYKREITTHARQGAVGLKKALELFHDMKAKDRLTPTSDSFGPLMYGCAKAGYTKKAFELYEESIKYLNRPTQSMVTCLLNACAESPFPEYGLKRLEWFLNHIKLNYNYELNRIQYHSAIKAYGKLGQLSEASKLVQEMISKEIHPDIETFSMLLIGCASNKDAGTSLAVRIFKRMKLYGIKPNIATYRLMLRCIRDCGMGSKKLLDETLGELPALTSVDQRLKYKRLDRKKKKDPWANFEWTPLISDLAKSIETAVTTSLDIKKNEDIKLIEDNRKRDEASRTDNVLVPFPKPANSHQMFAPTPDDMQLPNLLSDDHLDLIYRIQAIQVDKLKTGADRLMLFGGIFGFLEKMDLEGSRPDAKTFSLLLSCVKHRKECQLEYFRLAKDYAIKRDLLFYDLLIRHVCENMADKTRMKMALYFLEEMQKDRIRPNITTFESMALGCSSSREADQLLADVERCGFVISNVLIKRLFESALYKPDFFYLNRLIKFSIERQYKPVKNLVEELEEKRLATHQLLVRRERGELKEGEAPEWFDNLHEKSFNQFSQLLGQWLGSVELMQEEHPWSQFYVESTSKRQGFKNFVQTFKKLNEVKEKALEEGEKFGRLSVKALPKL